jgi:excisionase family DNA binding protein
MIIRLGLPSMSDEIMTINDIASYLKITEKTAYRLVSEGKIPGFKVGGSWRFNRIEIQDWAKAKDKQRADK